MRSELHSALALPLPPALIWQVRCIETGQVLSEFSQSIEPGKKINIVEQFNEKLILKQERILVWQRLSASELRHAL